MTITAADIDSLSAKLAALDVTAGERAALEVLFDAAVGDDDEVAGFAVGRPDSTNRYANLEVGFFRQRLWAVAGPYIGETEKNLPGP